MKNTSDTKMENNFNVKFKEIFNECGIKLKQNNSIFLGVNLPNKSDLQSLYGVFYNKFDSTNAIFYINKYVFRRNHFRILDADILLLDMEIDKLAESNLKHIFESLIITYKDEKINYIFLEPTQKYLKLLLNNKEFIKQLSKEFQLKTAFSTIDQLQWHFEQELSKLIEKRLMKLNFKEKADKVLPKLIMDHYLV